MAQHKSCQCCHPLPTSVSQTLDEMDFERGIWSAAVNGDVERVAKLLKNGLNPDVIDSSHHTALHYAARHNHVSICEMLLLAGAKVNAQTTSGHVTALHRAAYSGHCSVIQLLLERGADSELCDSDGQNALHKACEGGHISAIKHLLAVDKSLLCTTDNRLRRPVDCLPASFTDVELRTVLSGSTA